MNKKYIAIVIIVLAALGAYFGFFYSSSETEEEVTIVEYKVKKGDIKVGFEAEGTFITNVVEPSFVNSGVINAINVSVGEEVSKGTLLARLDSSEDYYAMLSAKSTYDKAIAAHHAFEASYDNINKSNFDVEDVRYYAEQENQLREASHSAEALYNKALNALGKNSLYSPIKGTIIDIYFNEGESVQNQNNSNPIMAILPKEEVSYVESFVEDIDIPKVKIGMNAKFTPDATNEEYGGTVAFISPKGITDNNGLVTYKVRIQLEDNKGLYDGFIGNVEYLSKSAENVLVVPNKAVKMINGKQVVFEYPNIEQTKQIKTGLTDGIEVEILEGLNQNDSIAITE